jgi:hypothetical protein
MRFSEMPAAGRIARHGLGRDPADMTGTYVGHGEGASDAGSSRR